MSVIIVIIGKSLNLYTLRKSGGIGLLLKLAGAQGPTLAIAEGSLGALVSY